MVPVCFAPQRATKTQPLSVSVASEAGGISRTPFDACQITE